MKQGVLPVLASLAILGLPAAAQEHPAQPPASPTPAPAAEPAAPAEPAPELVVEKPSLDLGEVSDEKEIPLSWAFTNKGPGVLKIASVQSTCGCTVASLDKKEYAPGESGAVTATFHPQGREGEQTKAVTIHSNDPAKPSFAVSFKCNVKPLVRVEPKGVNFGRVERGQGKSMIVTVTGRTEDFAVTDVRLNNPAALAPGAKPGEAKPQEPAAPLFDTQILETTTVEQDGQKFRQAQIQISMRSDMPVGRATQTLAITTNDTRAKPINIAVFADVQGKLQVTPEMVSLGVTMPGAGIERSFSVAHREGKAFKILSIEYNPRIGEKLDLAFAPTSASEKQDSYSVKITGKAPQKAARYAGEIIVKTDVPGEEMIKLYAALAVRDAQAGQPPRPLPQPMPTATPPVTSAPPAAAPTPAETPESPKAP